MNSTHESCVFLLENDHTITSAVGSLCAKDHLTLQCFLSWEALHSKLHTQTPNCLIISDSICNHSTSEHISHITREHEDLPVIILGRQHNLTGAVASIQAGAIDYIEKPVVAGRLAKHISSLSS